MWPASKRSALTGVRRPLMIRGGPNIAPWLEAESHRVIFSSWDAQAFLHHKPALAKAKTAILRSLASVPAGASSVTALQEVHGNEFVLNGALAHIPKELLAFSSFPPDGQHELNENAGGVATIISAPESQRQFFDTYAPIPGRALRVRYRRGEHYWANWNIHNFEISRQQLRALEGMVRRDMQHVRALPTKRFGFLCGDFNFLAEGDVSFSFAAPNVPARSSQAQRRPNQAQRQHFLDAPPEWHQPQPTHYTAASNTMARLTRMCSLLPNWAHLVLKAAIRKPPCPENFHRSKLSDHAPLTLVIGARPQLPARLRPVPLAVCADSRFALHFQAACPPAHRLKELPAAEHLGQVKVVLRQAGLKTRNDMVDGSSSSPAGRALLLTTIARVVWHGNTKHARELLRSRALAKEHLFFVRDLPKIRCHAAFEQQLSQARLQDLELRAPERKRLKEDSPEWLARRLMRAEERLRELWPPFGSKVPITVIREPGHDHRDPQAQLDALAKAWAPIYSNAQPIDIDRARQAVQLSAVSFDFPFHPPTTQEIHNFLARAAPQCPRHRWLALPGVAQCGPRRSSRDSPRWCCPCVPENFLLTTSTSPPSSSRVRSPLPQDLQGEVTRAPLGDALHRPQEHGLQYRGCCCQPAGPLPPQGHPRPRSSAASSPAATSSPTSSSWTSQPAPSTPTAPNPVADKQPLLLFTDFGQAFPSVLHAWLCTVLVLAHAPLGFASSMLALLGRAVAVSPTPNGLVKLFPLRCGAIQGDPAASLAFLLAFDPFIRLMARLLDTGKRGLVRGCADDLGFALRSAELLRPSTSSSRLPRRWRASRLRLPNASLSSSRSGPRRTPPSSSTRCSPAFQSGVALASPPTRSTSASRSARRLAGTCGQARLRSSLPASSPSPRALPPPIRPGHPLQRAGALRAHVHCAARAAAHLAVQVREARSWAHPSPPRLLARPQGVLPAA